MVSLSFILASGLMLGGAVAAMFLRNLVHCALALGVTLVALASLFLQLGAQFAGFAQILVYVGAVAILILFAILLTRGGADDEERPERERGWVGAAIALGMFLILSAAVLGRPRAGPPANPPREATVRQIGDQLMTTWVVPLEVLGLLLTAALIGAVIIAMRPAVFRPERPLVSKASELEELNPQQPKA